MNQLLNISVAASLEKSKLSSDDPWLPLVKITWPDASVLRLVRNVDDIVYDCGDGDGAQTYTAFSWDFGSLNVTADGSVPTWAVKLSNVQGLVESLLEAFGGGVGGSVSIYMVQASRLKREPALELDFDIVGSGSDAKLVNLTLGAESPFRILFGRHTYRADTCRWRYKSVQCGYSGSMPTCSLQLGGATGCRAHSNQLRFGAFPGIDSNGMRLVGK